ncbi:hypothetical protein HmCmsJML009_04680 [Escherichia coli]|nr:hypothetical protein HmCmsJML009_04680 [Escherichia coli]
MSGFHTVVGEFHHIFCTTPVALFNVVGIHTKRPVAVQRAIQHFCPRTAKHGFEITSVDLAVEAVAQMLEVVGLQVIHIDIILHILAHMGTHAR